jgi:haloalkane dehalogenase
MTVLRTNEARFDGLPDYDFTPHYVTVDGMRMHYVDEGPQDGPVALLLHGEPTWSYLYRHFIPPLAAAGCRVIAPDLIGFGKSDKPADRAAYSYAAHVAWLRRFVEALDLRDITAFLQDWGGLLGLRVVAEMPEPFARIMAGNTTLPTGDGAPSEAFLQWQAFSQSSPDFPIGRIVHKGTARGLTEGEQAAYDAPFPDEAHKAGARAFPPLVPTNPDDPARADQLAAWQVLKAWDKPFLCCFSDKDLILGGLDKPFLKHIPGTAGQPHFTTQNAAHFLQEDAADQLVPALLRFMGVGQAVTE